MSLGETAVRELFNNVVDNLDAHLGFDFGERPDMNKFNAEKILDIVWMLPMTYSGEFPQNMKLMKTYAVVLYFCRQDQEDSSNDQRRDIIEAMDKNVEQFLIKLKFTLDGLAHDHELNAISVEPFFIQTDDILTGKAVSFNLVIQDDFEYC